MICLCSFIKSIPYKSGKVLGKSKKNNGNEKLVAVIN